MCQTRTHLYAKLTDINSLIWPWSWEEKQMQIDTYKHHGTRWKSINTHANKKFQYPQFHRQQAARGFSTQDSFLQIPILFKSYKGKDLNETLILTKRLSFF